MPAPICFRFGVSLGLECPTPMGGVRTSRPTVLTVDDEPGVRESVRLILEDAYAVDEASSGWGAVEQIRGRKPDIVLLDVKMPDLDGLSVLEIVRAEAPGRGRLRTRTTTPGARATGQG